MEGGGCASFWEMPVCYEVKSQSTFGFPEKLDMSNSCGTFSDRERQVLIGSFTSCETLSSRSLPSSLFLLPHPITLNPTPYKCPIVPKSKLSPIVRQFIIAPEPPPGQLVVTRPGRAGSAAER